MVSNGLMLPPLKQWINGEWVGEVENCRPVINPASQATIAQVPQCTPEQLDKAIEGAAQAFPDWSKQSVAKRAQFLKAWHALIVKHKEDLVAVLSAEQGKPYAEARAELTSAAAYIEWFAEEARRVYGEVVPHTHTDKRFMVWRHPVGVVAAITPWNFPAGMVARKVAAALAVGCTIVLKPSAQTPLTALFLGKLAEEAGCPKGVFNIVLGNAGEIGRVLATDERIKKITFTGSTATGQILLEWAAPKFKRLSMELGGNAPFIIFEDADIDAAVEGVMLSKFRNAGQTCICANRLYVHSKHYKTVVAKLKERITQLRVGPGYQPDVQIGPLIDSKAVERALAWVDEAAKEGATVQVGGKALAALGPAFMEPTLLTDVTPTMKVVAEEIFAPVLPVLSFEDDASAIAAANSTPYGLAAYFYSENMGRIMRAAEALHFGMIGINTPQPANESVPFGGVKHSGMGREGSRHGLDDYTELKTVCLGGIEPGA